MTNPVDGPGENTLDLLNRARAGDRRAVDRLISRFLPSLEGWASGRMPRWARDLADTSDIVQETLVRTFQRIETFHHRGEGALQAYLRQAVMNRIRDEIRKAGVRKVAPGLPDDLQASGLSPLEAAIGQQAVEHYETALGRLRQEEREVVIARIELGCTYAEIARATGRASSDAARMAVGRALARLSEEMARERAR
jgi:RNA polymerase sigma-70 factor (ECF subfamily)